MSVSVGDRCLTTRQTYLKTADPMLMLRPPDLVEAGEVGEVVALHPMETVAVRFRRGAFLLPLNQLETFRPRRTDVVPRRLPACSGCRRPTRLDGAVNHCCAAGAAGLG